MAGSSTASDAVTIWLLSALVTAAACFIASITGFGFALLFIPLMAVLLDAKSAVVLQALIELLLDVYLLRGAVGAVARRTTVLLVLGSFVGIPLGLVGLLRLEASLLKSIIGVCVIATAALLAHGWRLAPAASRFRRPLLVGSISGALRTLTGIAGPPVIVYLLAEGFDQERLRATILAFFLPATVVAVLLFALTGELTSQRLTTAGALVPVALASAWLGNRFKGSLDEAFLRRLTLGLLVAAGLSALAESSLVRAFV